MDVFSLARASLRRWYLFVPLVIISGIVAAIQGHGVKPDYSRSASVILVAPPAPAAPTGATTTVNVGNPLGSTGALQAALVTRLNSSVAIDPVASETGGSFSAAAEKVGGIVDITAFGITGSSTSAALEAAIKQVSTQLATLEKDVSASTGSYYRVVALSTDPGVGASYPHRSRNIVLVALAGVLLSVLLIQLIDALLLSRGRRRGGPVVSHARASEHDAPDSTPNDVESSAGESRGPGVTDGLPTQDGQASDVGLLPLANSDEDSDFRMTSAGEQNR